MVWPDMAGLTTDRPPRFVKRYTDVLGTRFDAAHQYVTEVTRRRAPAHHRGNQPALPRPGAQLHLTLDGAPAQALGQPPQDRDELRRVEDLEVEALEPDVQGQLVQRVGPGVQDAGVWAGGFQPAGGSGGALRDLRQRRPERDAGLTARSARHGEQGLADRGPGLDRGVRGRGLGQAELLADHRPESARGGLGQGRPA
jgi:hypothetical protein